MVLYLEVVFLVGCLVYWYRSCLVVDLVGCGVVWLWSYCVVSLEFVKLFGCENV